MTSSSRQGHPQTAIDLPNNVVKKIEHKLILVHKIHAIIYSPKKKKGKLSWCLQKLYKKAKHGTVGHLCFSYAQELKFQNPSKYEEEKNLIQNHHKSREGTWYIS